MSQAMQAMMPWRRPLGELSAAGNRRVTRFLSTLAGDRIMMEVSYA